MNTFHFWSWRNRIQPMSISKLVHAKTPIKKSQHNRTKTTISGNNHAGPSPKQPLNPNVPGINPLHLPPPSTAKQNSQPMHLPAGSTSNFLKFPLIAIVQPLSLSFKPSKKTRYITSKSKNSAYTASDARYILEGAQSRRPHQSCSIIPWWAKKKERRGEEREWETERGAKQKEKRERPFTRENGPILISIRRAIVLSLRGGCAGTLYTIYTRAFSTLQQAQEDSEERRFAFVRPRMVDLCRYGVEAWGLCCRLYSEWLWGSIVRYWRIGKIWVSRVGLKCK